MSLTFSKRELKRMRSINEALMMDECQILTPSTPTGGTDPGAVSGSYGDPVRCGLHYTSKREGDSGAQVPEHEAEIRLPVGTEIEPRSRIKLTKRYGETLSTPVEFAVVGEADRGPSALVLRLERITGNQRK